MEIEFSFREEHSKIFGPILRPVAKVIFKHAGIEVPQWVYVDSGADMTLIPKSMGDLLGFKINEDKITEVKGVGERVIPVVIKKAKIQIGEKEIEIHLAWSLVEEVPMLLGRKDLLDHFEILLKNDKTIFRY